MVSLKKIVLIVLGILLYISTAAAAASNEIQSIRFSQSAAKIRIVLELNNLPEYKAGLQADKSGGAGQLIVDMQGAVIKSLIREQAFTDPAVSLLRLDDSVPGKVSAVINLKNPVDYKVFTLAAPNRIVIDILKEVDQKTERTIMPGLKYTEWLRYTERGPVFSYILDVDVKNGLRVKPVLSNDEIPGLERLSSIAVRSKALAAINGSYFALNGETIGTLKLGGEIAGIPELARTAFGILPDGNVIISQVNYQGSVIMPNGKTAEIGGVDCERGPDGLVLYNHFYGEKTNTNEYGTEYVIIDNKVTAINTASSTIPANGFVLSAHGAAKDALACLKLGDAVYIKQSLGDELDKAPDVLGSGPMLLKNGGSFVTAKIEEFPSDIAVGRAPRTALGVTQAGHILLVVVDGRQADHSIGMTLTELAVFMKELGAVQAMNLDGGGSSEMTIGEQIVNSPSDGRERALGTAVVVLPN